MKELTTEIRQQISDFLQGPGGDYYLYKLDELKKVKHNKAEDKPDDARDLTQRAAGISEARNELVLLGSVKGQK